MASCARNRSYMLLIFIFGLIDGVFIAFSDVFAMLFADRNMSKADASVCGLSTVACGVVASMTMGVLLKRTQKYLLFLRF